MHFAKLHGLGNDFVLLDLRGGGQPLERERAVALCDRHLGIGADGVLTLLPGGAGSARDGRSPQGGALEVRMLIQNSDGSIPEMCGNGARCAALWMVTDGCTRPGAGTVTLLTEAGPRPCAVEAASARQGMVEVDMGTAQLSAPLGLPLRNRRAEAWPVSMGNPHRVLFEDGDPLRLAQEYGPVLSRAENANIEFAVRRGPQRYEVAVYERGAGLTQACGTGACAVAAAAVARGEASRDEPISVSLPGGELILRIDAENKVRMRGAAELVFIGDF
jgi:diaminopimelate epimerase